MDYNIIVTLEIETDDEPGEVELIFHYSVGRAEPDVGIPDDYVADWQYTMLDHTDTPARLCINEIDKMASKPGVFPPVYINPSLQHWHECNLEAAMEEYQS